MNDLVEGTEATAGALYGGGAEVAAVGDDDPAPVVSQGDPKVPSREGEDRVRHAPVADDDVGGKEEVVVGDPTVVVRCKGEGVVADVDVVPVDVPVCGAEGLGNGPDGATSDGDETEAWEGRREGGPPNEVEALHVAKGRDGVSTSYNKNDEGKTKNEE